VWLFSFSVEVLFEFEFEFCFLLLGVVVLFEAVASDSYFAPEGSASASITSLVVAL